MEVSRGDVVIATLDPSLGSEQAGTRPCVVVQNDVGNANAPTTIVVPCTTQFEDKLYPFEVYLPSDHTPLVQDSVALTSQIETVSIDHRLHDNVGRIPQQYIEQVDEALEYSLGLQAV